MPVILQLFIIGANQDLYFEEGQESIIHIQEEIVCFRFRLNNFYMRRRRFCVLIRQNGCQPISHLLDIFPVKQSNESPLLVEIIFFCILTSFLVTNRKKSEKGQEKYEKYPRKGVVYFDQLSSAARTRKLVELLFYSHFQFFCIFLRCYYWLNYWHTYYK